jgi:hypothetical protein
MYDTHGRNVLVLKNIPGYKTLVLGKELIPGIYVLMVSTSEKTETHKLIKIE